MIKMMNILKESQNNFKQLYKETINIMMNFQKNECSKNYKDINYEVEKMNNKKYSLNLKKSALTKD